MGMGIARRAAMAAASVAVAATGLLATGGSASAATVPAGDRDVVVLSSARLPGAHDEGRNNDRVPYDVHGHGRWGRHDDGRRRWVLGQVDWARDHGRGGPQVREDDGRRRWVLGQVDWARDHGRGGSQVREDDGRRRWVLGQVDWAHNHAGYVYRWDGGVHYWDHGRWVQG